MEIKADLLEIGNGHYTLRSIFEDVKGKVIVLLDDFHKEFPMRTGKDKAEFLSGLKQQYPVSL